MRFEYDAYFRRRMARMFFCLFVCVAEISARVFGIL